MIRIGLKKWTTSSLWYGQLYTGNGLRVGLLIIALNFYDINALKVRFKEGNTVVVNGLKVKDSQQFIFMIKV